MHPPAGTSNKQQDSSVAQGDIPTGSLGTRQTVGVGLCQRVTPSRGSDRCSRQSKTTALPSCPGRNTNVLFLSPATACLSRSGGTVAALDAFATEHNGSLASPTARAMPAPVVPAHSTARVLTTAACRHRSAGGSSTDSTAAMSSPSPTAAAGGGRQQEPGAWCKAAAHRLCRPTTGDSSDPS